MPTYTYRCLDCDTVFRESSLIANRNNPADCECGGKADRDVKAELAQSGGCRHKWVTDNERWSTSMGVPPKQVAEFRKRFPNSTYRDDGRLLVKSRKDKMRQAKERGFVELDDRKD
ncbi:MAG: zinc ribbon domain-containing protein [Ketobacter sp.]|nr:zinc ribbon domain-containing protein [Ketobacter sp.]